MAERTARPGEAAEATRILAIQGDSTTGVSAPSAGSDAARGTVDESSSLMRTFGGAFFFFRSFFFFRAVDCRVILPDASCAGERVRYGPTDIPGVWRSAGAAAAALGDAYHLLHLRV